MLAGGIITNTRTKTEPRPLTCSSDVLVVKDTNTAFLSSIVSEILRLLLRISCVFCLTVVKMYMRNFSIILKA